MNLGFPGVYSFLSFALNIDCGNLLDRVSTIYVLSKSKKKYHDYFTENYHFYSLLKSLHIA